MAGDELGLFEDARAGNREKVERARAIARQLFAATVIAEPDVIHAAAAAGGEAIAECATPAEATDFMVKLSLQQAHLQGLLVTVTAWYFGMDRLELLRGFLLAIDIAEAELADEL